MQSNQKNTFVDIKLTQKDLEDFYEALVKIPPDHVRYSFVDQLKTQFMQYLTKPNDNILAKSYLISTLGREMSNPKKDERLFEERIINIIKLIMNDLKVNGKRIKELLAINPGEGDSLVNSLRNIASESTILPNAAAAIPVNFTKESKTGESLSEVMQITSGSDQNRNILKLLRDSHKEEDAANRKRFIESLESNRLKDNKDLSPLELVIKAAVYGELSDLKNLLRQYPNEIKKNKKEIIFCLAKLLRSERYDAFDTLVKAGADLNFKDGILSELIILGDNKEDFDKSLSFILYKEYKINLDAALLANALKYQKYNIFEDLLNIGADPNLVNTGPIDFPIHVAAKSDSVKSLSALDTLLDLKCNLNVTDSEGKTALMIAIENKNYVAMEKIMKAGADVNLNYKYDSTALATERNGVIFSQEKNALNEAIKKDDPKSVEILLENKANPDLKHENLTPAYIATEEKKYDILRLLVKYNADFKLSKKLTDQTPLHLAAISYDVKAMEIILSSKNVDIKQLEGSDLTALHLAIREVPKDAKEKENQVATIRCLVQKGAANIKNGYDETPIEYAFSIKNNSAAIALAEFGADLTIPNFNKTYPIHMAVSSLDSNVLKAVIQNLQKNPEALKWLTIPNKDGKTALDLASAANNNQAVEMLTRAIEHNSAATPGKDNKAAPK